MKLQHEADKPASGNTGVPRTERNAAGVEFIKVDCPVCGFSHAHRVDLAAAAPLDERHEPQRHTERPCPLCDVMPPGRYSPEPPRPDLLRRWLNVYEAPDAQAEAALARETVMVLNQVGGGVRADTGVDRSLPLTAGRGCAASGPPAAPLDERHEPPFDDVLRLSMAIDDHVLAWGPDEPVHDNGTCSTDCAGDILARYRSERPEETALETAKRVERHEDD